MNTQGTIVSAQIKGCEIRFFVQNTNDVIQSHHARGEFYEPQELGIIAHYFPPNGVFCDIGANVGNHTLYVCKYLKPASAIVFEPNPPAILLLHANLFLNDLLSMVDTTYLGAGLAEAPGKAVALIPPDNLGGTQMITGGKTGEINLIRGDDILRRRVDFIKMDVEGMELRALAGLSETISRYRPRLFIEVDQGNEWGFKSWMARHDYICVQRFRRYPHNENYMLMPRE